MLGAGTYDVTIMLGEYLDALANGFYPWGADEHSSKWLIKMREVEVGLEAVDLTAVGIPPHFNIHESERGLSGHTVDDPLSGQYGAGTGSPHGHALMMAALDGAKEAVARHQLGDGRRFAAWNYQSSQLVELLGQPDSNRAHIQRFERIDVLAECPLKRQNPDLHLPATLLHAL